MADNNTKAAPGELLVSLPPVEVDRLMEEINILRLEGSLFCFDPRAAKQRQGRVTLEDARRQPLTIEIHPSYGQPSVLAYRVLQAVFLKLTDEGCAPTEDGRCLYLDTISFSQRELAALAGRAWGGRTSKELYDAIMQLQSTKVIGSLYDKETDSWRITSFVVVPSAYFAGRGKTLTRCTLRLAHEVVASINRRHVAFFNLYRLAALETLGLVLYKRTFFHLSNLNADHKSHASLAFTKDYETICREWLGGLKPQRYKADIVKQLGRHLDALKASGLLRRYVIEKNVAGSGFNLTFYPGRGFFEDYRLYYLDHAQPRLRFQAAADQVKIQSPLELVADFHRKLGRAQNHFAESETAYADDLLASYDGDEIRDLIDYAVTEAGKTGFEMLFFGALKRYLDPWLADKSRRKRRERRQSAIRACPLCNEFGVITLQENSSRRLTAHVCPHDGAQVEKLEQQLDAQRISSS